MISRFSPWLRGEPWSTTFHGWVRFSAGTFGRYAMAVAATAICLLGRWLLDPVLGNFTPFITLYAAVAFAAIYAGFGPAILATVLGLIGADYWFVPPRESFPLSSMPHMVGTLTYLGVCTLIATAGETAANISSTAVA